MQIVDVSDLDDPRVAVYRSLRRLSALRADGRFVAEGARVVRRLLESDLAVDSLLLEGRWLDELRPLIEARAGPPPIVYRTSKDQLERIVGFHVHQGVMALGEAPRPPDLVPYLRERPDHVLVALEGVNQAENVGGLLRTMAGFGATGMILGPRAHDPYVRRAARVSVGAIFSVPVWRVDDLAATFALLRRECGTRSLAADVHEPVVPLDRVDLAGGLLIALGAEGDGLSRAVRDACDAAVTIPMDPTWDCLNVATSGAVILWEIVRRRRSE